MITNFKFMIFIINFLYLLHDLRNSNEIFGKDVTYDNIKSHKKKKKWLHPLCRRNIFGKTIGSPAF